MLSRSWKFPGRYNSEFRGLCVGHKLLASARLRIALHGHHSLATSILNLDGELRSVVHNDSHFW